MNARAIEAVLSRRFRVESAPTLAAPTPSKAPIAFTRLRCASAGHGRAGPVPCEASFAFQVLLRPMRSWKIWSDRSRTPLPVSGPGDIFLFDLSENPQLELHDPFDMVRCYISQSSMDSLSYEHGQRRVAGLRLAQSGTYDPVMHGIATSVAGAMERPGEAPTMFVEHMALAFHAHVSHAYGGISVEHRHSGGLTHWQFRRVCDAMQARLNFNHSIGGLASECGLSSRQFARAFKETTGFTPHQWLMRRRIERSRELLAQTDMELVDIALECGFVDQSHFSRVFAHFQKQTPAKWRRQLAQ